MTVVRLVSTAFDLNTSITLALVLTCRFTFCLIVAICLTCPAQKHRLSGVEINLIGMTLNEVSYCYYYHIHCVLFRFDWEGENHKSETQQPKSINHQSWSHSLNNCLCTNKPGVIAGFCDSFRIQR
jgi:hypothetical protein